MISTYRESAFLNYCNYLHTSSAEFVYVVIELFFKLCNQCAEFEMDAVELHSCFACTLSKVGLEKLEDASSDL